MSEWMEKLEKRVLHRWKEEEERRVFICGFWKGMNAQANPNLRGKSLGEVERKVYAD